MHVIYCSSLLKAAAAVTKEAKLLTGSNHIEQCEKKDEDVHLDLEYQAVCSYKPRACRGLI